MTLAGMAKRAINPERVYVVGVSAGGLMASVEAAAYPELFAAVGLVASAGYADGPCFTTGVGIPVEESAQLAFVQMGPRARVVPRFVIGSDADLAFPAACSDKALEQGLRTNNLALSGGPDIPLALRPGLGPREAEARRPRLHGQPLPRPRRMPGRQEMDHPRHAARLARRNQGPRVRGLHGHEGPQRRQGLMGVPAPLHEAEDVDAVR